MRIPIYVYTRMQRQCYNLMRLITLTKSIRAVNNKVANKNYSLHLLLIGLDPGWTLELATPQLQNCNF